MQSISITLSQEELTALAGMIDAAVKSLGIQSVKPAAELVIKLEQAVATANAPPVETTEKS